MLSQCFIKWLGTCLFVICFMACAVANEQYAQVFERISTEVSFRQWNQKGLGEVFERNDISVIKSPNNCGDIVILRWSAKATEFKAEVYRADACTEPPSEWQLVSDSQEKTLTDQHGQYFMILELVPGKEGGQKTERFKLPYQE